jgi:hypothetical protein
MTLLITLNQIHNPSDQWMSCTIRSSGTKICVSPIPPRSTRPVPPNLLDPQIVQETVLSGRSITKFTSSAPSLTSSVVEALELQIQGSWTGEYRIGDRSADVTCFACVNDKELAGWFTSDQRTFFFTGTLNSLLKSFVVTFYSSDGFRYPDVRGELQVADRRYSMRGESTDFGFAFHSTPESMAEIAFDPTISGRYLGFYERRPNSFELHAELQATMNGIVAGRGTEDNRQFTIFGMVEAIQKKFFFVRIKGNEVTYYTGEAQLQTEIFFQGKWQIGERRGGFTLIKCMPDVGPAEDAAQCNIAQSTH